MIIKISDITGVYEFEVDDVEDAVCLIYQWEAHAQKYVPFPEPANNGGDDD